VLIQVLLISKARYYTRFWKHTSAKTPETNPGKWKYFLVVNTVKSRTFSVLSSMIIKAKSSAKAKLDG